MLLSTHQSMARALRVMAALSRRLRARGSAQEKTASKDPLPSDQKEKQEGICITRRERDDLRVRAWEPSTLLTNAKTRIKEIWLMLWCSTKEVCLPQVRRATSGERLQHSCCTSGSAGPSEAGRAGEVHVGCILCSGWSGWINEQRYFGLNHWLLSVELFTN